MVYKPEVVLRFVIWLKCLDILTLNVFSHHTILVREDFMTVVLKSINAESKQKLWMRL